MSTDRPADVAVPSTEYTLLKALHWIPDLHSNEGYRVFLDRFMRTALSHLWLHFCSLPLPSKVFDSPVFRVHATPQCNVCKLFNVSRALTCFPLRSNCGIIRRILLTKESISNRLCAEIGSPRNRNKSYFTHKFTRKLPHRIGSK